MKMKRHQLQTMMVQVMVRLQMKVQLSILLFATLDATQIPPSTCDSSLTTLRIKLHGGGAMASTGDW